MARTNNLTNFLTDVAGAIKEKLEDDTAIPASQFDTKILSIETGIDTSDATATNLDILVDKTAYVNGVKITGTMPSNGELSYIPSTSAQVIPTGYTSGGTISAVTSAIDSNIVATNIKEGVTILGITGTYTDPEYPTNLNLSRQILYPHYTKLQYLQSTGNQYITTDVSCTATNKLYIDFANTEGGIDGLKMFRYGTISPNLNFVTWGRWDIYVGNTNVKTYVFRRDRGNIEISQGLLKINGGNQTTFTNTIVSSNNLELFHSGNSYSRMKLYSCKIYDNNVLTHNFIPARRDSDLALGLLDEETYTFWTNQGGGSFTAGPVVS